MAETVGVHRLVCEWGQGENMETASVGCLFWNHGCEEREGGRQRKMLCLSWERLALSSSSGKTKGKSY